MNVCAGQTRAIPVDPSGGRNAQTRLHLVAIHNVAAAEAVMLAMKAGLDADRVVEVIGSGADTSGQHSEELKALYPD